MTEHSEPMARIVDDSLELPLKWPFGMPIPSVYATQVAVTKTASEVILEFGEFLPTGMSHRTKEDILERAKSLEVRVVARIIMSQAGYEALEKLVLRRVDLGTQPAKDVANE